MNAAPDHDVIVLGGGPGGATASALLAREGHDVLVLEKEHFPRFRIGESLLPSELPILDKLGFDPATLPAVHKSGADFADERAGKYARYLFRDGMEGTPPHAWQVERAAFDDALIRTARDAGAQVHHGVRALRADPDVEGVTVRTGQGAIRGRYVIDATGRDRVLSRQHRAYERIDGFGRAAVWTHFEGLRDDVRAELLETGNILILMVEDGWGWAIPLPNGRMSVGLASAESGVVSESRLAAWLSESALLRRLTRGAERGPVMRLGDYSYRNTRPAGSRWACIGDARGFLDPVFSTGVAFAMQGAETLATCLSPALARGTEADPDLAAPVRAQMERAYQVFGSLIYRFYNRKIVDHIFFCDDPNPALRRGLISVMAGSLERGDNPFQRMLMQSTRRRRA